MWTAASSRIDLLGGGVEQAREAMPLRGRDVRGRREATFRCGSAEQLAQYEHRPVAAAPSAAA